MQNRLGLDFGDCVGHGQEKDSCEATDWMGRKMCFRCSQHKEAYERLTNRQKQYIAAYMNCSSRQDIGRELKINASSETIGKTLQEIAKRMRVRLRDLKESATSNEATPSQLKQLIQKQDYRCALSGEKLTPESARLDHKIAVSNGGDNKLENLQWLDAEVNRMKGSLTQERFIEICRKVTQWNS